MKLLSKCFFIVILFISLNSIINSNPRIMKKILYIVVFALSTVGFAQNSIEPQIEAQGGLVKATYFHDNGKVQQEGTFKDGKLDGKWTSYNEDGSIKQVAYYKDGMKTGTWITYNNNIVAQKIAYSNDGLISKK
jgi:uncharacterized protein YxeA